MRVSVMFFFFNDTATTEIYTLSLHALFRSVLVRRLDYVVEGLACSATAQAQLLVQSEHAGGGAADGEHALAHVEIDRKSTRLNSSHANISYAVFCLKQNNTAEHNRCYT